MRKAILAGIVLLLAAKAVHSQEIFDAVKTGDLSKVKALVEADPLLLQARDESGCTPLHWACRGDHEEVLTYLVTHKADVNAKDAQGNTPLNCAAQAGRLAAVRRLMDHGADAAHKSYFGYTPLLQAILSNSLEIAELLIANGADVNQVFREDYYGDTPLSFAVKSGNLKMVNVLHQNGADLRCRTKLGAGLLHFAAATNKAEIAGHLIDGGLDVDAVQNGGLTPLHLAAVTGGLDAAKVLVARGATLDARSKDGGTPLHFAVASRNPEIADLLRRSGARDRPREFPSYSGKYLGQKAPGPEPVPFVPELFRDIYRSYSPMIFAPDGKEVFWAGYFMPGVGYQRIWRMSEVDGVWTAPEVAPFSDFRSWQPMLSADGRKIYFASDRPRTGESASFVDLWYAEKEPDGSWSRAKHLGSPPNRDAYNEMLPSPAGDGTIYFKAFGPGARGTQMFKSTPVNGVYQEPVSIDDLIETNGRDGCADKDHLITYRFGDPRGAMISILFHLPDGRWTRPVNMGDVIHRGQGTSDGRVSPDGKVFFFVQNITPHWVDSSFIEDLKKDALKPDQRAADKTAGVKKWHEIQSRF
jgi:ankyrin repeat protein